MPFIKKELTILYVFTGKAGIFANFERPAKGDLLSICVHVFLQDYGVNTVRQHGTCENAHGTSLWHDLIIGMTCRCPPLDQTQVNWPLKPTLMTGKSISIDGGISKRRAGAI